MIFYKIQINVGIGFKINQLTQPTLIYFLVPQSIDHMDQMSVHLNALWPPSCPCRMKNKLWCSAVVLWSCNLQGRGGKRKEPSSQTIICLTETIDVNIDLFSLRHSYLDDDSKPTRMQIIDIM